LVKVTIPIAETSNGLTDKPVMYDIGILFILW
jgi:hypothetical protein